MPVLLPSSSDARSKQKKSSTTVPYTIPPLVALPAEFQRKTNPNKPRKRDKNGSDGGKKEEWTHGDAEMVCDVAG